MAHRQWPRRRRLQESHQGSNGAFGNALDCGDGRGNRPTQSHLLERGLRSLLVLPHRKRPAAPSSRALERRPKVATPKWKSWLKEERKDGVLKNSPSWACRRHERGGSAPPTAPPPTLSPLVPV